MTFAIDDPASWAALVPQLKICDAEAAANFETFNVEPGTGEALNHLMLTEGYFQLDYFVYDRAGLPCHVCGTAIKQIVQGQRSTYYCPHCQR